MAKGRKNQATSIKLAKGAFDKHPERRNHNEPTPQLGEPTIPDIVEQDPAAKARWIWVCEQLQSMNLLHVTDQGLIAGYCLDYSMMLTLWESIKGGRVSDMTERGGITTKPEANQFHMQQRATVLFSFLSTDRGFLLLGYTCAPHPHPGCNNLVTIFVHALIRRKRRSSEARV